MIGNHQLSPEAKEKAAKRRAKQAAEHHKVTASEREQAQQLKKQERKQEEVVSIPSLNSVRFRCRMLVTWLPCFIAAALPAEFRFACCVVLSNLLAKALTDTLILSNLGLLSASAFTRASAAKWHWLDFIDAWLAGEGQKNDSRPACQI